MINKSQVFISFKATTFHSLINYLKRPTTSCLNPKLYLTSIRVRTSIATRPRLYETFSDSTPGCFLRVGKVSTSTHNKNSQSIGLESHSQFATSRCQHFFSLHYAPAEKLIRGYLLLLRGHPSKTLV